MTDRELRNALKKGEISNLYLLAGDEPLLIENAVKTIKDTLKVNESFDLETFSLSEAPIDNIISRLYIAPFTSERRLIIIKNLEEMHDNGLATFAETMSKVKTKNCIVMIYRIPKGKRRYNYKHKDIFGLFPNARCVTFTLDRQLIHKWILKKTKRDNLNLSTSMIHYLVDEFKNDITGLKNEFEKIENYLYEAKTLSPEGIKDLAKGMGDFSKYQLAEKFLEGKSDALERFEELKPYLSSYAEIVEALTRGLVRHLRAKKNNIECSNPCLKDILDEIIVIDRKIKRSSYFADLMLELFLLAKTNLFRKGVIYGREMA